MQGRLIAGVLAATLATACATPATPPVPDVPGRALAPFAAVEPRAFEQVLTVSTGDRQRRFIVVGRFCPDHLLLRMFTPAGMDILRIRHDADGVSMDGAGEWPGKIDGERILAALQLVYWPEAEFDRAWSADWRLVAGPGERRLYHRDRVVATVDYAGDRWTDPVTLVHHEPEYRLDIRPLDHHRFGSGDEIDAACTEPRARRS